MKAKFILSWRFRGPRRSAGRVAKESTIPATCFYIQSCTEASVHATERGAAVGCLLRRNCWVDCAGERSGTDTEPAKAACSASTATAPTTAAAVLDHSAVAVGAGEYSGDRPGRQYHHWTKAAEFPDF